MPDLLPAAPQLGVYLLATLLICLAPGPNVLMAVSLGLRGGLAPVPRAVAGVVCASALFLALAALGLAAALHAAPGLYVVVRWVGAAYLVWVGARLVLAGLRAADDFRAAPVAGAHAFLQGFATQLSNPKSILYWSAFLPQFLDPARPLAPQIVALGSLGIAIDAVVLTGYGLVAAATHRAAPSGRFQRRVDVAAGGVFVATGVLLALAHA